MGSRKRRLLCLISGGALILALALIAPSLASADAHFSGAIDNSDPTQTPRLFRDGVPDTCAAPGTAATTGSGAYHYDLYEIVNNAAAQHCVTVHLDTACTGNNFIFSAAYSPSFDPNNITQNWLADSALSPNPTADYEFYLNPGQHAFINVHEVYQLGCPAYTVDVVGADAVGGGPPPPPPPPSPPPPPPSMKYTTNSQTGHAIVAGTYNIAKICN